jgi:ATP-dependent Lhr-like helicase
MLLRFMNGKRTPAALQRMRAEDLLSAVFPAQTQCQDNRQNGDVPIPDHPLVFETLRDCLTEALDAPGLIAVLKSLESGALQFSAKDTPIPSVFSHQILNAMPYAFLDNAPLEERRARAVVLRRALPERAEDLGTLDPEAIRSVVEDAWPQPRDADELLDLISALVLLPASELRRLPDRAESWLAALEQQARVFRLERGGFRYWAAADNEAGARAVLEDDAAALSVVRGWMDVLGPATAAELAALLGLERAPVETALAALEGEGAVLRGAFRPQPQEVEFCNRRILARIHRATIVHLRREIEPVATSAFLRFLFSWQHLAADVQLDGEHGLLEIVELLQGFETAAAAWEAEILPARMRSYDPALLDSLCLGGDVAWGRWTRRETAAEVPARRPGISRTAALGLAMRQDVPFFLDPRLPEDETALSVPARDVLAYLRRKGASFFSEITGGTRHLGAEVEEALWQLAAAGYVTADSYAALRSLISGDAKRTESSLRRRRRPRAVREGRWSLLPEPSAPENLVELRARQYLLRYGVLCRELLARETSAPRWRDLLGTLRRLEARGEIRGGRFVAGASGEQFALPEAVDRLRSLRRGESRGRFMRVSACDPLNLVGIITPGARVAAMLGNRVIYRDGTPVAAVENGETRILGQVELSEQPSLQRLLDERPASAFQDPVSR